MTWRNGVLIKNLVRKRKMWWADPIPQTKSNDKKKSSQLIKQSFQVLQQQKNVSVEICKNINSDLCVPKKKNRKNKNQLRFV